MESTSFLTNHLIECEVTHTSSDKEEIRDTRLTREPDFSINYRVYESLNVALH